MNDITTLERRAQLAIAVAASATMAKAQVQAALLAATTGHLDIAIRDDLHKTLTVLDRSIKHAEQCRLRLLRKADRKAAKKDATP